MLLNRLEELQDGFTETPHPLIDVTVIDGGQLIHSFLSAIGKITSYGNLARTLLAYACGRGGNEIHLLFDTYLPMPLKERQRKYEEPMIVHSSLQGCQKLLQNGIFKDQLAMFLLKELQKYHGPILANKTATVSHGGNFLQLTFNELDWTSSPSMRKPTLSLRYMHPARLEMQ